MKVAVSYRILPSWRAPVFERLSRLSVVNDLKVFHGNEFKNTKFLNSRDDLKFTAVELRSINFVIKKSDRTICQSVSPALFSSLWRYRPDVILCEGASNLANATISFIYSRVFSCRFVWWSLGKIPGRRQTLLRRLLNPLIRTLELNADAVLTYSTQGASYFKSIGVPDQRIHIAVNVVDTAARRQDAARLNAAEIRRDAHRDTDLNVLFVGAITAAKNVDILLRSFKKLQDNFPRCRLTVVGDGDRRNACITLAKELGIVNVSFPGRVTLGISRYFLESDIFVLPGLGGLAVSDALAHGVPVITGPADGCERDLLQYGAGVFLETMNETNLSRTLLEVARNPRMLACMRAQAAVTINEKHNIDTYIDAVATCLKFVKSDL